VVDCCFVEDTCIVVKNIAVLNRLGHPSRQNEIRSVEAALQKVIFSFDAIFVFTPDHRSFCLKYILVLGAKHQDNCAYEF
jgi:N-dimethylarginine dimethylaminohydrolase